MNKFIILQIINLLSVTISQLTFYYILIIKYLKNSYLKYKIFKKDKKRVK